MDFNKIIIVLNVEGNLALNFLNLAKVGQEYRIKVSKSYISFVLSIMMLILTYFSTYYDIWAIQIFIQITTYM